MIRSRSRDRKQAEREKNQRPYRNKSPPPNGSGGGGGGGLDNRRRYDRRGGGFGGGGGNFGGGGGQKQHQRIVDQSSKSRSRSPIDVRRKISRSISPSDEIPAKQNKRQRCRDFEEKGYCMRGETCPWDHGVDPVVLEDINNPALISIQSAPHMRGGEYSPDAPELWTRGGVGVGGGGGSGGGGGGGNVGVNPFAPRAPGGGHRGGPPGTYPRPALGAGGGSGGGFRAGPPFPFPLVPFPLMPLAASGVAPLPRELISVPVVDAGQGGDVSAAQGKRRYEPEDTVAIAEGPTKRKIPINSRLGPRVAGGGGGGGGGGGLQHNCSLELRKVPRGLNSIAHLNNHFSKFGKIVNIQISYEGDPEAAIITFSQHAEANVAYRSTEAVLNNRFIKVFWHAMSAPNGGNNNNNNNNDGGAPNSASHIHQQMGAAAKDDGAGNNGSVSRRNYSIHNIVPAVPTAAAATDAAAKAAAAAATNPMIPNAGNLTATGGAAAAAAAAQPTSQSTTATTTTTASQRAMTIRVNHAATQIIRKKQEDQVKAAVQLAHGLHKRKHDLVQEYLKQMRSAVELAERVENSDAQRASLLATIKNLQESIDRLNKEIASEQATITAQMAPQQPAIPVRKTKEQQKKELLDIELELIHQQQEGNDTTAIQKRIEELQRSLNISGGGAVGGPGGGGGGIGGTNMKSHFASRNVGGRVRPPPPGSTSVDRRPTTLHITGFAVDDADALLGHFKVSCAAKIIIGTSKISLAPQFVMLVGLKK